MLTSICDTVLVIYTHPLSIPTKSRSPSPKNIKGGTEDSEHVPPAQIEVTVGAC